MRRALSAAIAYVALSAAMQVFPTHVARAADNIAQELPSITVTGAELAPQSYAVPNTRTATKTDAPIMETPVSVQVIPQQVLQDQQINRLDQAVENVSGVFPNRVFFGNSGGDDFFIRGFQSDQSVYRDGFRIGTGLFGKRDLANVEQVEVLKGPASILYGRIQPGGLINYITKKPLASRYYDFEQQFGSYDFYRTTLDATGPINADRTLAYRLNLAYESSGSFREFIDGERYFVAPVLQWSVNADTRLTVSLDHLHDRSSPDSGWPAIGNRPAPLPFERNLGEPFEYLSVDSYLIAETLTHVFNDRWNIRQWFNADLRSSDNNIVMNDFGLRADNRTLDRSLNVEATDETVYAAGVDVLGKVETGFLEHVLLMGGDYYHGRSDDRYPSSSVFAGAVLPSIDMFDPVHGGTGAPIDFDAFLPYLTENEWYGLYLQDQLELPHHLHALAGFRYDNASTRSQDFAFGDGSRQTVEDDRLSPRGGLLWRPLDWLAVYGSYVENFGVANSDRDFLGAPLPPETAQQWEVGVKTEFADGRFSATVAYFDLTKENIAATDTEHAEGGTFPFVRAVGEANSRGVELDFSGELLPGWNVFGNYAYTDAVVTQDASTDDAGNPTTGFEGQALPQVPRHAGRIWTTYYVQGGDLEGLTLGAGITMRDERPGDYGNAYQLPGYATADLMAGYTWKIGRSLAHLQLNVDNLLDKGYFEGGAFFGPYRIIPGAPRTFLGSIRVEF